jgi:phosphatidylglycerol:prolipoprotein diacylglycerol transferase
VPVLHPWWPAGLPVHPHLLFESLSWMLAWRLFLRDRSAHDPVDDPLTRATLLTVGVVGGALGAKLSVLLEDPWTTAAHLTDLAWLTGGRSVVGGLLGAWAAVEVAKWRTGVAVATGDAYVRAIGYGLALGRVGCFFSGVTDGTHGIATTLPWGMDLGDGIARHPTAMYEILFLLVLVPTLGRARFPAEGDRFKALLIAYLGWRLWVESLKTQPFVFWGLSGIQVQCLAGLAVYGGILARRRLRPQAA